MKTDQDKQISQVSNFVTPLLLAMGLELDFRCEPDGDRVLVHFSGHDAGMVLSNGGRLLYAINHILNRVFYEKGDGAFNILVDCNNFRVTRAEELESMAQKAAARVKETNDLHACNPMPASERRVVHLALAEDPAVVTESEGRGLTRRVVILPAAQS